MNLSNTQLSDLQKITSDTWKIFAYFLKRMEPTDQYMQMVISKFLEYEQLWKYSKYWEYAGRECSAKLQEIERVWKKLRGGTS